MKGKGFQSKRDQGGWIGIAVAVAGAFASSASEQSAADKKNKTDYASQRDLSNLSFQQQAWLSQQSEAWAREDATAKKNYSEDAIRSFAGAAPPNAVSADGSWGAAPARSTADTTGLAPTQANGQAVIIDPRTGKPMNGNAAPLSQLQG